MKNIRIKLLIFFLFISSSLFAQEFPFSIFHGPNITGTPSFTASWNERPVNFQLFPRATNDSGTITVSGTIINDGYYTTCLTELYKNNSLILTTQQALAYGGNIANFSILNKIKAEKAEYKVRVLLRTVFSTDSLIYTADSLVAGDVYIVQGQSNAQYSRTDASLNFTDEYIRTFGIQTDSVNFKAYNLSDTLWHRSYSYIDLSVNPNINYWYNVGAIGQYLQKKILDTFSIPTVFINGSVSNTSIKQHTKNTPVTQNYYDVYGKLLYRMQKAKLTSNVKAIIWFQGESDMGKASTSASFNNPRGSSNADGYLTYFDSLYKSWKTDYTFKNIFVFQISPTNNNWSFDQLRFRGKQSKLATLYGDTVRLIPTLGSGYRTRKFTSYAYIDEHYEASGYKNLSDYAFAQIRGLYYGSSATVDVIPPSIKNVFYTNTTQNVIGMTFNNSNPTAIPSDTVGMSAQRSFLLNRVRTASTASLSLSTNKDTMYLTLASPSSATYISYSPTDKDSLANGTDTLSPSFRLFDGPYIRNSRGLALLSFDSIYIEPSSIVSGIWYAETYNYLGRISSSSVASPQDTNRIWIIDSLIMRLKVRSAIWQKLDAIFLLANKDTISALENWIANASNYKLTGKHDGVLVPRPTFVVDSGYRNSNADSVYLMSNIIPQQTTFFVRDSGTISVYSGLDFTADLADSLTNGFFTETRRTAYGIVDSLSSIVVSRIDLVPKTVYLPSTPGQTRLYYASINQAGNNLFKFNPSTAKGIFTTVRISRDSAYGYRDDSLLSRSTMDTSFQKNNRSITVGAINYNGRERRGYFGGKLGYFAIGGKLSKAEVDSLRISIAWYLDRVGAVTVASSARDTNLWQAESKALFAKMHLASSTIDTTDKWNMDSLISRLKADTLFTGWDALFIEAAKDTAAAKISWTTLDSNYLLTGRGQNNIAPNIPTFTSYRGYKNEKIDSVWLSTNVRPDRLFYFKKDSGTVCGWSGDWYVPDTNYAPNNVNSNKGALFSVIDSTAGQAPVNYTIVPWNYAFGAVYNLGHYNIRLDSATAFRGPGAPSPKGFFSLTHQELGATDSIIYMINDTIRYQQKAHFYFRDIPYPFYLGASNFKNTTVTNYFRGRNVVFAIGKRRTTIKLRLFYKHLEWYLNRIGGLADITLMTPTRDAAAIMAPDSGMMIAPYNNVQYDFDNDSLRMYTYNFDDHVFELYKSAHSDGVNWRKFSDVTPSFFESSIRENGSATNWYGLSHGYTGAPSRQYFYWETNSTDDGITWTKNGDTLNDGSKWFGEDHTSYYMSDSNKYYLFLRTNTTADTKLRKISQVKTSTFTAYTSRRLVVPADTTNYSRLTSKDYAKSFYNGSMFKTGPDEYWLYVNVFQHDTAGILDTTTSINSIAEYNSDTNKLDNTIYGELLFSYDGENWRRTRDTLPFLPINNNYNYKQIFGFPTVIGDTLHIYTFEAKARHNQAFSTIPNIYSIWRYRLPVTELRKYRL